MEKRVTVKRSLRNRMTVMNISISLAFIIISAGLLLFLIYNVLEDYGQNEVDFRLNEISGNLTTKTELLADILLRVREDDELINALNGSGLAVSEDQQVSATDSRFRNIVDIYSPKNHSGLGLPFLQNVYLFDSHGNYNNANYDQNFSYIQEENNKEYYQLYQEFLEQNSDVWVITKKGFLHILYTLYDKSFAEVGTLVFSVNQTSIEEILIKTEDYSEFFWFLADRENNTVLTNTTKPMTQEDYQTIATSVRKKADTIKTSNDSYRIYTSPTNMGIYSVLGVSSDQMALLLFDSFKIYLFALLAAILVLIPLIIYTIFRMTQPLSEVASKLQLVANEEFDTKLPDYNVKEFDAISTTFNSMTDTINHLINDVYEKQILAMNNEIKFVQSQMNPHFMFNVLNTISLQAKLDGNDKVHEMASNFAALTQARLNSGGSSKITLREELQYVRFYLDLQKARFGDRLYYDIHVEDPAFLSLYIPKLTIETIVENAVLHGIEPKSSPGNLTLSITQNEEAIKIIVSDDGVGFPGDITLVSLPLSPGKPSKSLKHNRVALNNSYKMIQYYYGEAYGISIQTQENVGTTVEITIPKDREGKDVPYYTSRR